MNNNNNSKTNKNEEYWFNDLNVLFQRDKLDLVIPTSNMSYKQKTNSIVRLSIYLGVLISIFTKNYLYLYIPICVMTFSYIMYLLKKVDEESNSNIQNILNITNNNEIREDENVKHHLNLNNKEVNDNANTNNNANKKESFKSSKYCEKNIKSTVNNPFMNPNPYTPRDTTGSCAPLSEESKKNIRNNFNRKLFKDANDIFNSRNGFRQFYTVPGNTFPNNRDTFMKWLYDKGKSCKEGNGQQCYQNMYHHYGLP